MTRKVTARLSRWSLALVSLGVSFGAIGSEANLLSSTSDARYRAIGQLMPNSDTETSETQCTGSVVAGSTEPDATRAALVLTAAHCLVGTSAAANVVQVDQDAPAGLRFTPAYFQDAQGSHASVGVDRILYLTLKGVDMAVLQLDVTYGELRAAGIRPLVPAASEIVESLPVELVHIPVDDVPPAEQFVRLSTCLAYAPLRLYEKEWYLTLESRIDCAGVSGGTSGAPVLRQGTSDIVGVLGTGVDSRFEGCGWSRPCELPARQPVSRTGASYQSLVTPLLRAFHVDGSWDSTGLDQGNGVHLTRIVPEVTRSHVLDEGESMPARWGVLVGDATRWIRYKHGDAATINCAQPAGYGDPVLARENPMDRLPLEQAEGVYAMCVIGQSGIDNDWQLPEHASVILRVIDDTPPTVAPDLTILDETGDKWTIQIRGPYVSDFLLKGGPTGKVDCDKDDKYRRIASTFVKLPKAKATVPFRFCVKGLDEAGNPSPVGFKDFHSPSAE